MLETIVAAIGLVADPYVLAVIFLSAIYGLFVGAIPGLSATMAIALLVPVTFFMPAVPAIAAMVVTAAMAIFAGDIPGCLLRIPGTPASAAYVDESHAFMKKGKPESALGASLVFSAIGGLFGTVVLMTAAPLLAEFALNFSSYEYFWLVLLGLSCAIFISTGHPAKGLVSLSLGLLVASVGMSNPAGHPRFTFGSDELLGGISLIPMMVGMFAVSEVIRYAIQWGVRTEVPNSRIGNVFTGMWGLVLKYPKSIIRGSVLGTLIGALPGAGADIAAYVSYSTSKKLSKEPEKFGTGHPEGLVEAGAANNAAVAGGWIPALVFGIPGDSATAIIIGVLYMKDLNPGPMIFTSNATAVYAIFIVFILANLLMLPLGYVAVRMARKLVQAPRNLLMPIILVFCIVGSYSINNSLNDVGIMLGFGILAYLMEENGFPIAPAILGAVLGRMLEENFVSSMIKSDGNLAAFFERPISAVLGVTTLLIWIAPPVVGYLRGRTGGAAHPASTKGLAK